MNPFTAKKRTFWHLKRNIGSRKHGGVKNINSKFFEYIHTAAIVLIRLRSYSKAFLSNFPEVN